MVSSCNSPELPPVKKLPLDDWGVPKNLKGLFKDLNNIVDTIEDNWRMFNEKDK